MNPEDIKAIIEGALSGTEVQVSGEGSHVNLVIIGDVFDGVRTLKRQQLVYAALNEHIASGAIHAVNMKLFTPSEWAAR